MKFCTGAFKSAQPNMLWSPFNVQDVFALLKEGMEAHPRLWRAGDFHPGLVIVGYGVCDRCYTMMFHC